jgi:hypothetical protein
MMCLAAGSSPLPQRLRVKELRFLKKDYKNGFRLLMYLSFSSAQRTVIPQGNELSKETKSRGTFEERGN